MSVKAEMAIKRLAAVILAGLLILTAYTPVIAETKEKKIEDNHELEDFFEKCIGANMEKHHVPGVAVVVVKDGKVILKKGYGYSDLEEKIKVDPDITVFRSGSVGKLFTQTAIMQLYERGQLRLDHDVNKYLKKIQVDNRFSKPLTMENLLTHTGGLDEILFDTSFADKNDVNAYESYMKSNIPKVVDEPGKTTKYSNIGTNLLGYIVQVVSGIGYKDYIKNNIFEKLDMRNSVVSTPIPNMSKGYIYENNKYREIDYVFFSDPGSGDINSTVADMGKFMIAHLQNGEYQGKKILQPATVQIMHKQHFTHHPRLPGMAYGFIEDYRYGKRVLKHEGAVPGFATTLFLIPETGLGVYIATNALGPMPLYVEDEFFEHYFKQEKGNQTKEVFKSLGDNVVKFTGSYRDYSELSKTGIAKFMGLLPGSESKIIDNMDGTLTLEEFNFKKEFVRTVLKQVEPYVFKREDNQGYVVFRADGKGNVTHFFNGNPIVSYEKLKWYEKQGLQRIILMCCLAIFSVSSLVWFIRYLAVGSRGKKKAGFGTAAFARLLGGVVCFLNCISLIGIIFIASLAGLGLQHWMLTAITAFLVVLFITSILTFGLVMFASLAWRVGYWTIAGRIHYSVVTVASLVFVWVLNYWNLLRLIP